MDLEKIIKPFNGEGDVGIWFKKVKLVAQLRKIKDLAAVIPLFLEGQAFMVYDHMDAQDQEDSTKIELALLSAFSIDAFQAYEQFRSRIWENEPVDVFVADLIRLADLAGIKDEVIIQRAFVTGLPNVVSRTLRVNARTHDLQMPELIQQARVLMSEHREIPCLVATRKEGQKGTRINVEEKPGQIVHSSKKTILCWICGMNGHTARNCEKRHPGNEKGETVAPAATP